MRTQLEGWYRTHLTLKSAGSSKQLDHTSSNTIGMEYSPPVLEILHHSRNAVVARVDHGIVLKYPRYAWWKYPDSERTFRQVREAKTSFSIEEEVLRVLGDHPRIVQFLGASDEPRGLKFLEADRGSLQAYIDGHFEDINSALQRTWCKQATESIAYVHSRGVIHSDLRAENFLLCSGMAGSIDLRLCDFGGAKCGDLGGDQLPDAGFFDPRKPWVPTKATDIFGLGSVFYTIMTGHWPHREPGQHTLEEAAAYGCLVDELFLAGKFPSTEHLWGGPIIKGCWTDQYKEASDILQDKTVC